MNVLVVVAHPDDEVLMCGGTLAKRAEAGDVVHVSFLAQGVESRGAPSEEAERDIGALHMAAQAAALILGVRGVNFYTWPDQALDTVPALDLAQAVEAEIRRHRPDLVITHSPADCNLDHNITFRAVQAATRPRPGFCVQQVWVGECASSTEWGFGNVPFQPNTFVDIAAWTKAKLDALAQYKVELRPFPHPRSLLGVRVRDALRGVTVGYDAAEAFQCLWRKE